MGSWLPVRHGTQAIDPLGQGNYCNGAAVLPLPWNAIRLLTPSGRISAVQCPHSTLDATVASKQPGMNCNELHPKDLFVGDVVGRGGYHYSTSGRHDDEPLATIPCPRIYVMCVHPGFFVCLAV